VSLHVVVRSVHSALKAKGAPFDTVYGPERFKPAAISPARVVIDHGPPGSDSGAAVMSQRANPKLAGQIDVGCVMRVYARSPKTGARVQDHRDLCERIRDLVWGELCRVVVALPTARPTLSSGGFTLPEDIADSEVWPGAMYELSFSVPHGIAQIEGTWDELMTAHAEGEERPGAVGEVEIVATSEAGPTFFSSADTTTEIT
jgi:hypothetical protein